MKNYNVKKENLNEIQSRVLHNGKVVRGEAGKQLLRRQLEKQAYYERNRSR